MPYGDRTQQLALRQSVAGFLSHLTDRGMRLALALVHATARGGPPAVTRNARVTVMEQQRTVVVDHDHAYRRPRLAGAIRRIRDRHVAALGIRHGVHLTSSPILLSGT